MLGYILMFNIVIAICHHDTKELSSGFYILTLSFSPNLFEAKTIVHINVFLDFIFFHISHIIIIDKVLSGCTTRKCVLVHYGFH